MLLTRTQSKKGFTCERVSELSSAKRVLVDCSSVNPSFSKKMAAAQRRADHFVDAP